MTAPDSFRAAFDQLEHSVLITDRKGNIEYVNAAFERVYGYASGDVIGKTPRILSASESATTMPDYVYDDVWRGLLKGVPRRSTFRHLTREGRAYDEDTSISLVRDSRGTVTHTIWIGRPAERKTTIDLFRKLVNSAPAGVALYQNSRILFANGYFKRITGYRERELIKLDPLQLIHPDDRESVKSSRGAAGSRPYEYRLIDRQGAEKWVLESLEAIDFLGLETKRNRFSASTIIDITDHKAAQEQLEYALTAYAATLESTTDAIVVIDTNRIVRQFNRKFAEMWGIDDPADHLDKTGDVLLAKMKPLIEDLDAFAALGHRVFLSEEEVDGSMKLVDGRVLEVHTKPQIINGDIAGQVWSFRDVTERDRMQSALLEVANLDSLTGLPGRSYFQDEVNLSISRGEHGAVLFMDVDDFKAINDSLGHSAGDELLRSLASCLSKELRQNDLLARLGGDEFAVLLRGASRAQAKLVAERLLRSVREMKSISADQPFTSTISIGAALFPAHGTSVDELLGHADLAMYQVKREGRNSLHFFQATHRVKENSISRVVWKQKILDALDTNSFELHAQPIYELSTGRLGCYELLLRLKEPNGKLILPARFLPVAERSGLMQQIDAWVIKRSLDIAKQLSMMPRPAKIAFNLSASAVGNPVLLDLIRRESARLKLETDSVSIEVTETALISDLSVARTFLHSLKDLGFLLALDDFGAGFSSLSRLKEIPADYLKIDGSFVENVSRSPEDRHFIRAIADLASGLGIGAVAESIEDAEAVDILISLGVLNGQGFYLGRPRPINEVLEEHARGDAAA
ncbi:MAG TPA: EAL domain-containing protein [Dehalococcoidia bacterium]|nr:EAL domain-containing protein [Dehalococcoidia bacterium]